MRHNLAVSATEYHLEDGRPIVSKTDLKGKITFVNPYFVEASGYAEHELLGAPFEAAIEMNLRIRNSALSEFSFNPKRHVLHSFNQLPHLDGPDAAGLETYA